MLVKTKIVSEIFDGTNILMLQDENGKCPEFTVDNNIKDVSESVCSYINQEFNVNSQLLPYLNSIEIKNNTLYIIYKNFVILPENSKFKYLPLSEE